MKYLNKYNENVASGFISDIKLILLDLIDDDFKVFINFNKNTSKSYGVATGSRNGYVDQGIDSIKSIYEIDDIIITVKKLDKIFSIKDIDDTISRIINFLLPFGMKPTRVNGPNKNTTYNNKDNTDSIVNKKDEMMDIYDNKITSAVNTVTCLYTYRIFLKRI